MGESVPAAALHCELARWGLGEHGTRRVPGIVGTLWSVDDWSTALVMVKFYEYHLRGDEAASLGPFPPAEALGHALRSLRGVTGQGLMDYFAGHIRLDAARWLTAVRMSKEMIAKGIERVITTEPGERPFADRPIAWAPFVFVKV